MAPVRVALALVFAAVAAAPAALADGSAGPRVSPRVGGPHTTFAVYFTAPEAAGHQGVVERSYEVGVTGPPGRRCVQGTGARVVEAARGERVHALLRLGGGRWCRGAYRGTIAEEQGPHCDPGQVCPLFVTRVRTIGHFRFRVR